MTRLYGYPGDGINGVMGALRRAAAAGEPRVRFVQVRHEESAAFMACAHAKFTGEPGVCVATSGPGAIHLLNGLYDAKLDRQPVVALVGQQARACLGGVYQQEVDLVSLFKDVASEFVAMATDPAQVRHLIDRAVRVARASRSPTCVILPNDLQEEKAVEVPPHKHGTIHSSVGYTSPRVIPTEVDLRRAAAVLNEGKKVAMLIGAGTLGASAEVLETAELLGAGIAKALLGKAALPDDLSFVTGAIGLLGTEPSDKMMKECDTLLMVGSNFPYAEFLPKEDRGVRGVQIDLDGRVLALRHPMEVPLVGDAAETLRALRPFLQRKEDRAWRGELEDSIRGWWKTLEARAMMEAKPLNPQRVVWELSPRLPDDCIIAADSGSVAGWFARDLKIRRGMMASVSGTLATMGCAMPYAVAAKFCFPDRPAIALVGDGSMQMLGNSDLITAAKYWREWSDPRLIVLVLNNRDLNMVTWEQRVTEGDPKFDASQAVPDFPYARYAEMLGLVGLRVDHPDKVATAWDEALLADRPVVLEAVVDPDVPILPPHITLEQAAAFGGALLKGDSSAIGVIRQSLKDMAAKVLPG